MERHHLWIDGQWIQAKQYSALYAPYSKEAIGEYAAASLEEANQAIEAAVRCKPVMAQMPAYQRADILEKVSRMLYEDREQAAKIIAVEAAKPLMASLAEVERTVQTYKFAAEEAKREQGETLTMDAVPGGEGRLAYTLREPVGAVAAITPFNFPLNLVAHKLGPALAAGNTVVLKPAEQTPRSALYIAELFAKAGLPAGALNVITGDGALLGDYLVKDPRIQAVTFTGSTKVGEKIRAQAGLKRVSLELGSNSAVIIDRTDQLSSVISRCVLGAFSYQGQVCISLQRMYVLDTIWDEFVEQFLLEASKLRLGDPLSPETDLSVLITPKETERVLAWIGEAKSQGARLVLGGDCVDGILKPTVLLNAPHHVQVSCQEVFAPVVVINKVHSVEEAIEKVNDSSYGLQAGIYTDQLNVALNAIPKLQVGGVMINDIPTFRVDHMPYGGIKGSGTGREGVKYAIEELSECKLVVFNGQSR